MIKLYSHLKNTFVFLVFLHTLSPMQAFSKDIDPYLWLEEVRGDKAISWVKEQNKEALDLLTKTPSFKQAQKNILSVLESKDKIPEISFQDGVAYNFWQDATHVRGILRKASLKSYLQKQPNWETILDIDKLAKKEKQNWVYAGANCLREKNRKKYCLLSLSHGGKDARVVREFDMEKKEFVKDGFNLPEAKQFFSWIDKDHIFISTDFGGDSLTKSGYPRIVKIWKRGTPLSKAKTVFKAKKNDILAGAYVAYHTYDQKRIPIIYRAIVSHVANYWVYDEEKLKKIPIPKTARPVGYFKDFFLISLRKPWKVGGKKYKEGSVLALNIKSAGKSAKGHLQLVFEPDGKLWFQGMTTTKDKVLIVALEDVKKRIFQITYSDKDKKFSKIKPLKGLDEKESFSIGATDPDSSDFFIGKSGFLKPNAQFFYTSKKASLQKTYSLPQFFNPQGMVVEQKWAESKDKTKVPYFIVGKKSVIKKGKAPTLLYGYGGFGSPELPWYLGAQGKVFLEKGGVFILANIRGGSEFGPNWHTQAIKKNRHKAFEDFIAVAEDLIKTNVTSKDKLAIQGGSNGGLLVGAVMTKRPDLFKAVICQVPLLDMIRYTKLLAGDSWAGEYGDPKKRSMRKYLLSYSPYHQVKKDVKYPHLFLITSTADDRVHPGHARKMFAKMKEQGHKIFITLKTLKEAMRQLLT